MNLGLLKEPPNDVERQGIQWNLDRIASFDLSREKARMKKKMPHLTGDDLDLAEREMKRFFSLIRLTGGNHVISGLGDLLWHELLLDTSRYRAFCFGSVGTMVDHEVDRPANA